MWSCRNCGENCEESFDTCWKCGTSRDGIVDDTFQEADDPEFDEACWEQSALDRDPDPKKVTSHLIDAVIVTLCCCFPLGIVAIVYAAQVNSKLAAGDYEGAVKASKSAEKWVWAAVACGLIALVVQLFAVLLQDGLGEQIMQWMSGE